MINYFYNIILKTDNCDLYSDVLTSVRKDYYLSHEKQKGKITQNSSSDTLYYEFSIEKDKGIKWRVSDENTIISDSKNLENSKSCVNYYGDNGLYKVITFSKYHTLLQVDYFNMSKSATPFCTIEPRKSGNDLCLLLSSSTSGVQPSVLFAMPAVDDEYIQDKIDLEFDDYTAIASTNEGVVKFLSETQMESFEKFVDRATAMKLTDLAPEKFIDDEDAVLAQKLNPKDFNIKRNLSEIVDISEAQEFSFDNIVEELLDNLDEEAEFEAQKADVDFVSPISYEPVETVAEDSSEAVVKEVFEETVEETTEEAVEETIEEITEEELSEEPVVSDTEEASVEEVLDIETIEDIESFELSEEVEPDSVIKSGSAKYLYFGELDGASKRNGFGRTATEDGRTAYEGEYHDNKRNGIGAYYYKNSQLCYYGEWKNNKREGFGVGVSSVDNSIHVGNFKDNKPADGGARVNSNGEIEFVRKALSNGVVVELKFDGDKVTVSKFNKKGELVSENTSNLMYF
ncbi:MAG: hypothetical protein IJE16_05755 [Ruminococcus sp.]|nr:hypothetical protein [Ruminococcus sp.]